MIIAFTAALAVPLLAAAPASQVPTAADAQQEPRTAMRSLGGQQPANCRDTIEQVRQNRGLPRLDRDNAAPGDALMIAAVEQQVNGCSVLVMRNDTSDVRPLPPRGKSAKLRPID